MKLPSILKRLLYAISVGGGILIASCEPEAIVPDDGFALYYPAVSEIAPGTDLTIVPTCYGGVPSAFSITSVSYSGTEIQTESFSINAENGSFKLSSTSSLDVGVYRISISCQVNGKIYSFSDIIQVELMKRIPDGIVVEPSFLSVGLMDVMSDSDDVPLPTAKVTTTGEHNLKIEKYLISNVYLDGVLANEYKPWFSLSEDGVFSITSDKDDLPELIAGVFTFDFKLTTYAADEKSEEGLFPDAMTLVVTSPPTALVYPTAGNRVEVNSAGASQRPQMSGSADGLQYSIKSVSPDNAVNISVDPSSGVLTFPAGSVAEVGDKYTVSLTVSNDYGTKDFDDVFTFTVIGFLDPVTKLSYNDVTGHISGVSLRNDAVEKDGAEVIYSFAALPEALSALSIDGSTGTVSVEQGTELPVGDWTVTVRAENMKGYVDASFSLNVVPNPNKFTYVRWGNNLGEEGQALLPLEKYGNQFRIWAGSQAMQVGIVASDIPEGRPVTFVAVKPQYGNVTPPTIDAATGQLTISPKGAGSCALGFAVIEVTVGEGEAAIMRKFPVFVDYCDYLSSNGWAILYTPFAIRVNPKTGGESAAPKIVKQDGTVFAGSLDLTSNMSYFNINGPAEHENSQRLSADPKSFLHHVWDKYYTSVNQNPNYGTSYPVSYWNKLSNDSLDYKGYYVDNEDGFKIKVNAEKFKDTDGNYADGAIYATFNACETGGINPQNGQGRFQANRVLIWLDPDYVEN